jgi:hypothetical protein
MHLPLAFFIALGCLQPEVTALPTTSVPLERRNDPYAAPRLLNYVQTFHDVHGQPLSLLPLLNTSITHINLAALHINADPNAITLNDLSPNDASWDEIWSEVKQLQRSGIKVLVMLGGAAVGSYERLCGTAVPAVIVYQCL